MGRVGRGAGEAGRGRPVPNPPHCHHYAQGINPKPMALEISGDKKKKQWWQRGMNQSKPMAREISGNKKKVVAGAPPRPALDEAGWGGTATCPVCCHVYLFIYFYSFFLFMGRGGAGAITRRNRKWWQGEELTSSFLALYQNASTKGTCLSF